MGLSESIRSKSYKAKQQYHAIDVLKLQCWLDGDIWIAIGSGNDGLSGLCTGGGAWVMH